ncbi:hypothetical protein OEZ85_008403 [Tetradesmus obliquus]|uniref:PH domain-containing protein n=1 Tax=Tetradesmus obliquus TaxID=3088 RepID=A0ABY8TJ95_TETOB|nr:hypothetical protein OEZ85_008403 [Tetradesmus obliquus]
MRGFLLKRNAEHRKANLIGPKYKRRWVELTGQTLVYAATQQDLLAGKVFAVREMKWVKADGDDKFQVRFPERVLTFKVEAGGKHERDTWVEALEQAKQLGAETGRRRGSAEKLEQLKKTAEEMLLEQSEDSGSASTAYRGSSSSAGGAAVRSHPTSAGLPSISIGISSGRLTETGQRPPSPRSALASAKAGSMFVANSNTGAAVAPLSGSAHFSAYEQEDSEGSCTTSVPVGVKGVKADSNWLDDDFDD